jgi:hypothetical protein
MRGVSDEACAPTRSGLYLARLGEEPSQIVQTHSPYTTDSESGDLLWGLSYALSPDQTVLVWTDNDLIEERSQIKRRALEGGPVDTMFETPPIEAGAPPYTFKDREMVLYFVWLP